MKDLIKTRRVSVIRYQPETLDLRDRIVTNGGTLSTSSLAAVDVFVVSCKTNNIWSKLIDVGLFVGSNLAAALTKLKYPTGIAASLVNVGFVSGDYHETGSNGGLAGDGIGKYLNAGTMLDAVSHLAFYNRTVVNNAATRTMIGGGAADNATLAALRHTTTADQFAFGGQLVEIAQNNKTGLFVGSAALNGRRLFLNGTQIAADLTSHNLGLEPDQPHYVFARNQGGTAAEFWSGTGSFYALCQSLTPADVTNLYSAVQTLQSNLNRAV